MTIPQAFALAIQHLQAGRLREAEGICRQILTVQPNHADALHFLGIIAHQVGRHDLAVEQIRQSLVLAPNNPAAHSNLGEAYRMLGRIDEAIASYHRAIQLQPDDPAAHLNLGAALAGQGRFDEAMASFRRTLQLKSDCPEAHHNLGNAFREQRQLDEAMAEYRKALALRWSYPEAHYHLGNTLQERGQLHEALAAYREALAFRPDDPEIHNNLGNVLNELGESDEAIATHRRTLELKPDHAEAHNNLGNALKDQSRLDEAVAEYRRAFQLKPGYWEAQSNLIYSLLFHPDQDQGEVAEEQRLWNQRFAEPLIHLHQPHPNHRDPERRLRIGYVSSHFNCHVICLFFMPLLEAHDKADVEIFCYANMQREDHYTERLKKTADVWRAVPNLADEELAARIRADQIDILVDLSQHMSNHRLLTFARKPAPIQISWLGYPAPTGLPTMDYRFTDALMEPENSTLSGSEEMAIRLPDSWFCFDPIEYPEPSALPALRTGNITFGSLNNFCKVNETILQVWVAVLQAVEGSRLLLHCPAGATQSRLRQWFETHDIAKERLELVAKTKTRTEFQELFHRIDIGLDSFPYNGGTTTCEALWMGVPVVSLAGKTAVSRLGLSVLTTVGLADLVASSEEEYVRIAVQLARDLPRLAEVRQTLRAQMKASPLMDAPRFARNIEATYRTMWRRWCAQGCSD